VSEEQKASRGLCHGNVGTQATRAQKRRVMQFSARKTQLDTRSCVPVFNG